MSCCVKCKQQTPNFNEKYETSIIGKLMLKSLCSVCGSRKSKFVKAKHNGRSKDVHNLIGKLPRPKNGFTPGCYKYMGPYNPLDKQQTYDKNTGDVTEW